jgi:hypothetical protein
VSKLGLNEGLEDDRKEGENDSDDSAVSGKNTASQMGTDSEEGGQARVGVHSLRWNDVETTIRTRDVVAAQQRI